MSKKTHQENTKLMEQFVRKGMLHTTSNLISALTYALETAAQKSGDENLFQDSLTQAAAKWKWD